jgi:signal peptidase I
VQGNGNGNGTSPARAGGGAGTTVLDPEDRTVGTDRDEAGEDAARTPVGDPPPAKHSHRSLVEWLIVLGLVVLVLALLRTFVVQPYSIPSGSMSPTLVEGDRVAVSPLSYELGDVSRGDIVVFDAPASETDDSDDSLIKRVVGLPGESIEIENDAVIINGIPLDEPYVGGEIDYPDMAAIVVPAGEVFLMGDNRADSRDSRSFGPVPVDDISGRALMVLWPPKPL